MTRKIIKAINVGVDTVDCPLVAGGSVGAYRVGMGTADIEWLSTKEAARRLGVTPRTLYRFIDDGQLGAHRMGRVIRVQEAEVADFINRCRIQPGSLEALSDQALSDQALSDQAMSDGDPAEPADLGT